MILNMIHVNINCTDVERSVAFYQALGFQVMHVFSDEKTQTTLDPSNDVMTGFDAPAGARQRGCVLSLGDDPRCATKIELIQSVDPPVLPAPERTQNHAGVSRIALRTKNLMQFYEELKAKGITFLSEPVEIDIVGAKRYVLLLDPDDVILDLVEF